MSWFAFDPIFESFLCLIVRIDFNYKEHIIIIIIIATIKFSLPAALKQYALNSKR